MDQLPALTHQSDGSDTESDHSHGFITMGKADHPSDIIDEIDDLEEESDFETLQRVFMGSLKCIGLCAECDGVPTRRAVKVFEGLDQKADEDAAANAYLALLGGSTGPLRITQNNDQKPLFMKIK